MVPSWILAVDRDDLARTTLLEQAVPEVGDGDALLRVDRVGVTANNVTYAVLGKAFRYWDFFPTAPGWGVVPLWGFAEVVASAAENWVDVEVRHGPEALRDVWLEVLAGRTAPRVGHVLTL